MPWQVIPGLVGKEAAVTVRIVVTDFRTRITLHAVTSITAMFVIIARAIIPRGNLKVLAPDSSTKGLKGIIARHGGSSTNITRESFIVRPTASDPSTVTGDTDPFTVMAGGIPATTSGDIVTRWYRK